MDEAAGGRARGSYREPRIKDYGTLAQLTGDGAPLLMRQLGVAGGTALLATAPSTPGEGGGGGGGGGGVGPAGVAGTPAPPVEGALGGDVTPAGGDGPEGALPSESGANEPGAGRVAGEGVAGADELPFTGLGVAATAAAGAASAAAGVALRKALPEDAD